MDDVAMIEELRADPWTSFLAPQELQAVTQRLQTTAPLETSERHLAILATHPATNALLDILWDHGMVDCVLHAVREVTAVPYTESVAFAHPKYLLSWIYKTLHGLICTLTTHESLFLASDQAVSQEPAELEELVTKLQLLLSLCKGLLPLSKGRVFGWLATAVMRIHQRAVVGLVLWEMERACGKRLHSLQTKSEETVNNRRMNSHSKGHLLDDLLSALSAVFNGNHTFKAISSDLKTALNISESEYLASGLLIDHYAHFGFSSATNYSSPSIEQILQMCSDLDLAPLKTHIADLGAVQEEQINEDYRHIVLIYWFTDLEHVAKICGYPRFAAAEEYAAHFTLCTGNWLTYTDVHRFDTAPSTLSHCRRICSFPEPTPAVFVSLWRSCDWRRCVGLVRQYCQLQAVAQQWPLLWAALLALAGNAREAWSVVTTVANPLRQLVVGGVLVALLAVNDTSAIRAFSALQFEEDEKEGILTFLETLQGIPQFDKLHRQALLLRVHLMLRFCRHKSALALADTELLLRGEPLLSEMDQ
eukprot:TRINITY_DN29387_c0_g1_i1.p1 TRINITY_DN29387_c0_g1~~TRINITY_DN29387_c0_g1_i1.p1  ORF type:complete len:542 (+),score=84.87 TRINITY_DN29387_c0_g1_i1:28-1626(+)